MRGLGVNQLVIDFVRFAILNIRRSRDWGVQARGTRKRGKRSTVRIGEKAMRE